MTLKYFKGFVDSDWHNNGNWSLTENGGNDTTKALSGDAVINATTLDITGVAECLSFQSSIGSLRFDGSFNVSEDFEVITINGLQGAGNVNIQGDISYLEAASQGNTIIFTADGTTDQNFDFVGTASAVTFDLRVNKTSGKMTNISNMNASNTGVARLRLTLENGEFDGNGFECKYHSLNVNGGLYTAGSGLHEITYGLNVSGGFFNGGSAYIEMRADVNVTGGVFTNTSGTMEFASSTLRLTVNGGTYLHNNGLIKATSNHFSLDMNGAGVYNLESDFDNPVTLFRFLSQAIIYGNMIQTKGSFTNDGLIIDLHGDYKYGNSQSSVGSLVFNMVGIGDQDIYFDKAGGLGGSGAGIISNKITGTLTFFDQMRFFINSGVTFLKYMRGAVSFDALSVIIDNGYSNRIKWKGGTRIPHFVIDKLNPATSLYLDSDLEVENFENKGVSQLISPGKLNITGKAYSEESIDGSAEIEISGSALQEIDCIGNFGGALLTFNKSGNKAILTRSFKSKTTGGDLLFVSGDLDLNGFNFTVNDQHNHIGGTITDSKADPLPTDPLTFDGDLTYINCPPLSNTDSYSLKFRIRRDSKEISGNLAAPWTDGATSRGVSMDDTRVSVIVGYTGKPINFLSPIVGTDTHDLEIKISPTQWELFKDGVSQGVYVDDFSTLNNFDDDFFRIGSREHTNASVFNSSMFSASFEDHNTPANNRSYNMTGIEKTSEIVPESLLGLDGNMVDFPRGVFSSGRQTFDMGLINISEYLSNSTFNGVLFQDNRGFVLSVDRFIFKGANHFEIRQKYTSFDYAEINKCSTCNGTILMNVNKTLNIASMAQMQSRSKIKLDGDLIGSGCTGGDGHILFNGSESQSVNFSGILPGVIIKKGYGLLTQDSDLSFGSFITYLSGGVDFVSKGFTSSLKLANNVYWLHTGRMVFAKIVVDKDGFSKYDLMSALRIAGDLVVNNWGESFNFDGEPVMVGGDVIFDIPTFGGNSDLVFTGAEQSFKPALSWLNTGKVYIDAIGKESDMGTLPEPSKILREDGGFMLREDGNKILREGI